MCEIKSIPSRQGELKKHNVRSGSDWTPDSGCCAHPLRHKLAELGFIYRREEKRARDTTWLALMPGSLLPGAHETAFSLEVHERVPPPPRKTSEGGGGGEYKKTEKLWENWSQISKKCINTFI